MIRRSILSLCLTLFIASTAKGESLTPQLKSCVLPERSAEMYERISNYLLNFNCLNSAVEIEVCSGALASLAYGSAKYLESIAVNTEAPGKVRSYQSFANLEKQIDNLKSSQTKLAKNLTEKNKGKLVEASQARLDMEIRRKEFMKYNPEIPKLGKKAMTSLTISRYSRYAAYAATGVGTAVMGIELFLSQISTAGQEAYTFNDLYKFINSTEEDQCKELISNPELHNRLTSFLLKEEKSMKSELKDKIKAKSIAIDCGVGNVASVTLMVDNDSVNIWKRYDFIYDIDRRPASYIYSVGREDISGKNASKGKALRNVSISKSSQKAYFLLDMENGNVSKNLEKDKLSYLDRNALETDYFITSTFAKTAIKNCFKAKKKMAEEEEELAVNQSQRSNLKEKAIGEKVAPKSLVTPK